MIAPGFTIVGQCSACGQNVQLNESCSLQAHQDRQGDVCPNVGYSPMNVNYSLQSEADALRMAYLILQDTDMCLDPWVRSTNYHTLSCGDGEECNAERSRRGRALAEYLIVILRH